MSDRYGLSTIATELHDAGVLVVTLNRPEHRNSLDPVMHLELKQVPPPKTAMRDVNSHG